MKHDKISYLYLIITLFLDRIFESSDSRVYTAENFE